jgi:4'-phosphopantetheinyl transferase EntD
MTMFEPTFRLDLAHGRCVGVALPSRFDAAPLLDVPPAVLAMLPEQERKYADALAPLRRVSWVGGRVALRAAVGDLAPTLGAILATARGAPRLPPGLVGSISHKDGLAIGLAAPADGGWQLGVDLEHITRAPGRPDISRHVLHPEEAERLSSVPEPARSQEVLFAFSAKEAIYKALDPFVERYVAFGEVVLRRRPDGTAEAALHLRRPDEGPFEVEVTWTAREEMVITTARVRRAP